MYLLEGVVLCRDADVGLFVWFCKRRTVAELVFLRRVLTVMVRGQGTKGVRGCGVLLVAFVVVVERCCERLDVVELTPRVSVLTVLVVGLSVVMRVSNGRGSQHGVGPLVWRKSCESHV